MIIQIIDQVFYAVFFFMYEAGINILSRQMRENRPKHHFSIEQRVFAFSYQ